MKKLRTMKKKISGWFCKYINGTKGVITLFLALLMVPFVLIAGALLNLGRFNSAIAVFDEALCNASNSTLGTYDKFLRSRFGLLAISQDFPDSVAGYTADEFISETFNFYMEQNGFVLNDTFQNVSTTAAGVYPLADTDVLMSSIQEYGKYSVPLKMTIDGFNLDDILGSLTKKLSVVTSAFNFVSSVTDSVTSYSAFNEKLNTLKTSIESSETSYTEYKDAYQAFKSSVLTYNSLIDERSSALASCQRAINNASSTVNTRQYEFNPIREQYGWIADKINELKNDKDSQGRPIDHSDEIEQLEKDYEEDLKKYREAETALNNAKKALERAQTNLETTKENYRVKLNTQRQTIQTKKDAYIREIGEMMAALTTLNSSISSAQVEAGTLVSKGAETLTNGINLGVGLWESAVDSNIKDLEAQKKAAAEEGNTEVASDYSQQIAEQENSKSEKLLIKDVMTKGKDDLPAIEDLESFSKADYSTGLNSIYSQLNTVRTHVNGITIPGTDSLDKMTGTGNYDANYFYAFTIPITVENVEEMMDSLFQDVMSASFIKVIKAIVAFIKAILSMILEAGYDFDLTSVVDPGKYSAVGGMPSSRSQESFQSQYLASDKELSDANKEMLGEYSSTGNGDNSVSAIESAINAIIQDVNTISDTLGKDDWSVWTFLGYLSDIGLAAADIAVQVLRIIGSMISMLGSAVADAVGNALEAVGSKMLLVGYIGYNTPNRTTYLSKSLTGATYVASLPSTTAKNADGYAFYGAETEYIIFGKYSEKSNQLNSFYSIFFLRLIYNTPLVLSCAEAQSVASAAGAATAVIGGIGYPLVMILWILLESFVDSTILTHGGTLKYVKTTAFLSIAGIPEFVKKIFKLTLPQTWKESLSNSCSEALNTMTNSVDDPEKRSEINSKFWAARSEELNNPTTGLDKVVSVFEFDYTKVLMIFMLFKSSDVLLRRTADIIQMEATWNEKKTQFTTTFDLGKSYTYIRATGSFSANQFITTSEDGFTSPVRIIYRGY